MSYCKQMKDNASDFNNDILKIHFNEGMEEAIKLRYLKSVKKVNPA